MFRQHDTDIFNTFIIDSLLVGLPICGRLFTWFCGDGHSMSRLDKFLLSPNWCSVWPNSIQVPHQRGLSDHVPLALFMDQANWGPHLLMMLNCWMDFPGYSDFARERWRSYNLHGWGGYVLKDKLKLIKGGLRECHQEYSQNLEDKLRVIKDKMASLDLKGELSELLLEEVAELQELSLNFHSLLRVQSSMYWQKARLTWLQEGYANSKFSHVVIKCEKNTRRGG